MEAARSNNALSVAGAVVVTVAATAAAPPPAGAAALPTRPPVAARPARPAAAPPPPARPATAAPPARPAAVAPSAPPPPPALPARPAPPAARPLRRPLRAGVAAAAALFVLGCAAAALALFAIALSPASSRFMGPCAPTDEEAEDLRAASKLLLLSAGAQTLAATVAVLVPARPVTLFACALGAVTTYHASFVVGMLVDCQGRIHGALAVHFWFFFVVLYVVLILGVLAATFGDH